MASIEEAFAEVENGNADFCVVPVENSTEGAVHHTFDMFLTTPLKICGEIELRVHQNLLSRAADLAQIERVYSHAQSLAQCRSWLRRHLPKAERIAVSSNAEAARRARNADDAAAIAGLAAAQVYGLKVLAPNIEDRPDNTTRFLVLGKHDAGPSGRDKTSLIMSAPNRTGALHELLLPLSSAGVSMCRLESRPARNALWEYVFYVDIEGHREEAPIKAALEELARRAAYLKTLGSYPVAVY